MGLSYPIVRDKEDQSPQTIAWHLAHHLEKSCRSTPSTGVCAGAGHLIAVPQQFPSHLQVPITWTEWESAGYGAA
jgi:hypothetical protein